MKISWFQLIKQFPSMRSSLADCEVKGWYGSKTVWYGLVTSGVGVLGAIGFFFELSSEEKDAISAALSVGVPAVLFLADRVAILWLRARTDKPVGLRTVCKSVDDQPAE